MTIQPTTTRRTYAGLFMVTLASLMYETLLTRIFSVTMWYHFAFVAVSVALFGMTVGAVLVYLYPRTFTPERAKQQLALSTLGFAVAIVLSFLTHLSVPFIPPQRSVVSLYSLAFTYAALSVPFVLSGICVCLAMTRFPLHVSKLYAADLLGAALGCVLFIFTLRITDGPTAVVVVSVLASGGALLFAIDGGLGRLRNTAIAFGLLMALFAVGNTWLAARGAPLLRLMFVKGYVETPPLYEKWNSFSRIKVDGDPNAPEFPFGWGLSRTLPQEHRVRQLHLNIDAGASTILTAYDGDLKPLEHLKYDVTNLVYYLRSNARVLAIGAGGGRDILSAFVFNEASVVGVEINEDILGAVNRRYGDFTGHLDRDPRVRFVNDEARSWVARQDEQFDIIQVSLIDTWAATAAGAFVLSENSLYTVEAWRTFLEHLTPQGVLTMSRWYFRDLPAEAYRLTALASTTLLELGVRNPREHIIMVRNMNQTEEGEGPGGVGTILISRTPFTSQDIDTIEAVAKKMQFDLVLTPRYALDPLFGNLASGQDLPTLTRQFRLNISAPTDDSPFFFHMLRLRDAFNRQLWRQGSMSFNMRAVFVLATLLVIVLVLTVLCIIVPLALTTDKAALRGTRPFFIYFAAIGMGFMLVEISQMQRLSVFLGHPSYGLSVVLFALLLSSGVGSYSTRRLSRDVRPSAVVARLGMLVLFLVIFGILTPYAIRAFQAFTTPVRVAVAVAMLLPLGLFMGMCFPLGMRLAAGQSEGATPLLWGVNGATSVCASVLAVVIALSAGISASFWSGLGCYLIALIAYGWASRGNPR